MNLSRSLWPISLLAISLWLIFPQSALTASIDQAPVPTPTTDLAITPISQIPQALYPELIYGALVIVGVIVIGTFLIRAKNR